MVDQKIRREVSVLFLAPASNYAAFPHNSSTKKKGKKEKKFLRTRLFSTSNFFFFVFHSLFPPFLAVSRFFWFRDDFVLGSRHRFPPLGKERKENTCEITK